MVSVLHTFGSDMKFHLHVRFLITFGGVDENGRWVWPERNKQLGSYREICKTFTEIFLMMLQAHRIKEALVEVIDMSKNTSVTLGEHFEEIIEKSIESGRYSSASEVIREGLRLVEEREKKINLLREAIEAGEKSGYVKNFDPIKHLAKLNEDYAK